MSLLTHETEGGYFDKMTTKPDYEKMFSPKSVAFIGASATESGGASAFILDFQALGFTGRIYPVNPKASEIHGYKCYPNIGSIPETVDFAIVSVPRQLVPQILNECADAGTRNIHIFTAGFRETGTQEGLELEAKIKQIAKERNLAITGPNGMGPYVPKSGVGTWQKPPTDSGPVAVISQSGTIASACTNLAWGFGIRFSKVISFGNGIVLDSTDFLEYFASDPETEMVAMYLEGVGDGRKLTKLVKEMNPRKPIIIMKGGLTESGARAVASHTGSLAGSESVWNAFFKQTGAVRVNAPEELMDMAVAFTFLHPLRGRRLGLIGGGGGMSVSSADTCAREGLVVPPFTEETRLKLAEYVPAVGTGIANPLDAPTVFRDLGLLEKTLHLVGSDPTNDGILIYQGVDMGGFSSMAEQVRVEDKFKLISDFARNNPYHKPVAVVMPSHGHDPEFESARMKRQTLLADSKVAVFPTLRRAAQTLGRFADYHAFVSGLN